MLEPQLKALDPAYLVNCDSASFTASSSKVISTFCSPLLEALWLVGTEPDVISLLPKHVCGNAHYSLRNNSTPRRIIPLPTNCFSLDIFPQQLVLQKPHFTQMQPVIAAHSWHSL